MNDAELAAAHMNRGEWRDVEAFHHRMRSDTRFSLEVGYACEHGIPLSVFQGRCWPNPRDPAEEQWLEDDRATAITYMAWRSALCPRCGLHPLDWERERDETWKAVSRTCWGCVELHDGQSELDKASEGTKASTHTSLVPRPRFELVLLEAYEADEIGWDDLVEAGIVDDVADNDDMGSAGEARRPVTGREEPGL